MLERETKREKNLEGREREMKRAKAQEEERKRREEGGDGSEVNIEETEEMRQLEQAFFDMTKKDDEN